MEISWKPTKRQEDFASIPTSVFEALFGGAAGGGKSELLMMLPILYEWHQNPRFKGILFRRTYPELEREIILRSRDYYPHAGATYKDAKKRWDFPSGAIMQFGYAEHEKDVRAYDTTEYSLMEFDELTSFTEFQYMYLSHSRCRSASPELPAIVRSGSNPGNIGHGFVRRRFVEPARNGYTIIRDKLTNILRMFIPAKATDNPHLMKSDPGYIDRMRSLPIAERLAKLEGDWWTFSGQVFDDWREEPFPDEPDNARHVIQVQEVPFWWPRVLSIDWGFAAQTVALWFAIDPGTRKVYVYREYVCTKTKVSTWATDVAKLSEGENLIDVVIDPSAYGNRGDELTIAQQFESHSGLRPRPADNDRIGGKELIQEYLRFRQKPKKLLGREGFNFEESQRIWRTQGDKKYKEYCDYFLPQEDEINIPKLQVFDSCTTLIKTIPLCVYNSIGDKGSLDDVKEFAPTLDLPGDDPYDSLRYGLKACHHYLEFGRSRNDLEMQKAKVIETFNKSGDMTSFVIKMNNLEFKQRDNFKRFRHKVGILR